jgi:poly(3-hydroxybutyrate) depolymerase
VDAGGVGPVARSIVVDVALVALFGVQHSVMARAGFKRWWTRVVPPVAERSTYVLVSSLLLVLLVREWRAIPAVVWSVESPVGAAALRALLWGAVALVVGSTFAMSHPELFGLDRAVARWQGRRAAGASFRTPLPYRVVRHPMQLGFVVLFWATPVMTLGHLLLALGMTAYVLVGVRLEERDLVRTFGREYEDYRRRVPRLVPRGVVIAAGGLIAGALALGGVTRRDHAPDGPAPHGDTLTVGGRVRTYRVYAPEAAGGAPRPVVVALHGASGDGALMRALAGGTLERMAREAGLVVAYPDGWKGAWNDCRRAAPYAAKAEGVDDVAFVRALVGRLARDHGVDPARAYVLGFSNGAQLALRLALEAPDAVAGVAALGAGLPEPASSDCTPAMRPVRVFLASGTRDAINPHAGGDVRLPTGRSAGRVRSAEAGARWLAALGGVGGEPSRVVAAHGVERATWARPGATPAVTLLTVERGTHAVARRAPLAAWLGDPDARVDAVEEAVRFFLAR